MPTFAPVFKEGWAKGPTIQQFNNKAIHNHGKSI